MSIRRRTYHLDQHLLDNPDCDYEHAKKAPRETFNPKTNLIGSKTTDSWGFNQRSEALHAPVIDIDVPCYVIPSSTPGHGHLYIEKEITAKQYRRILKAFVKAGIVEQGILNQFDRDGQTFVRPNHVRKPDSGLNW